jgi:FtsP/CotA-like multicopper oxidase with cupredoxin domain
MVLAVAGWAFSMPMGPTDETNVPHYFGPYPNWANSPFTGSNATVEVQGDGSGATAVANVDPITQGITSIDVTSPGSGYTTANVMINGGDGTATASATINTSGSVTGVTVDLPGGGYTSPQVSYSGGGGAGTTVTVGNPLIARTYATDFASAPGTLGPVFVLVPVTMPASGVVQSIQYFNQATNGSSPNPSAGNLFHAYVLHPTGNPNEYSVLWDSGELTVPVTADPVGVIETIPVPSIAVTTGDTIAFYGQGIPVDDSGSGSDILSYPALSVPILGSTISLGVDPNYPIFSQNRTYSFGAQVLDTSAVPPMVPATGTAYGSVDAVVISDAGSGYTIPTVEFDLPDDPNGIQARGHAVCLEVDCVPADPDTPVTITEVVVDEPGSGYLTAPNVAIHNGTLFDPINLLPGGLPAVASTTLSVTSVMVDNGGSGYVSAPTVTISDANGSGSGASATATVDVGGITGIAVTNPGTGYLDVGMRKFIDDLPGLCTPPACPASGKYIPTAVAEGKDYNGIAADEYVIGLVQYRTSFSSDLPPTLVRGYVQLETADNVNISQHWPVVNELLDGTKVPVNDANGNQYLAVTPPQYLGPVIAATKNKPVRIVFRNLLPTGSDGDLFLPTDSSLMGSGMGPMDMGEPMNDGTVMDEVRNPMCSEYPKPEGCFADNRATLHLHGGISPWISDGTAHQWITPAGEATPWPQGVSVEEVPDMNVCDADDDGCQTFYYTNQQSARLLFYHDHSWGITRLNVYAGEAAGYLITDATEQALISGGKIPADQIPLIIQDKTFVPDAAALALQDPTWDAERWGGKGSFWYHHVYMPAQNPGDPGGMSAYGRWMYGPWFWPPAADTKYGPIDNPYYDPACNLDDPATWQYQTDPFCEPKQIPGTPNISVGMEQFNDTPIVNGVAYPKVTLEPKSYRLRVLSAANDRFFNLQWYIADPTQGNGLTEVALNPAELAAAQTDPTVSPTPVQGTATAGPDWIQIGTEGGFLPAPVVVDGQQPTTWITDPTRFDVGNVDKHSLLLAPAERADVIVDFSKFAGKTLILYNDAPAAFPARVPSYDYYTGAPDLSPVGAPTILPGYGPNTRTVMQVTIANNQPAAAFNLTNLQNAFKHNANGTGVFESSQHPIIVGQAAYNSAYGTSFAASSNCNAPGSTLQRCDGLVRVNDTTNFSFNSLLNPTAAKITMPMQPKAIHDEMNATTFDEFGRMQANLGIEAQPPTPGQQNVTLYPFVNPATEIIDATNLPKQNVTFDANGMPVSDVKITPISNNTDGTQIWRVTHNGVDTHPIHFHLYDVQLVNRVTWDNIIIPTDANELGWKDTVRIAPLEDTIVALRPIIPEVPWELPNAIRMLNPMMPAGSQAMFNNIDVQGNPTNPIINQLVNFGWEYVYHCHILSHEEMDMMRPVSVALPPVKPDGLAASTSASGNSLTITVGWNDNSIAETAYVVQRADASGVWTDLGTIDTPLDQTNTTGVKGYADTTAQFNTAYQYRIVAKNTVGYGLEFPSMTVQSVSDALSVGPISAPVPSAPSGLTATAVGPFQVNLAWTDNASDETGFTIERALVTNGVPGAFAPINNVGANVTTYSDTSVAPSTTYVYRVFAFNPNGNSPYSNEATVTTPAAVLAPTNLAAQLLFGPIRARLTWTDNSNNENQFQVWRSTNGGAFSLIGTVNRGAAARTATGGTVNFTNSGLTANNTYSYYVVAVNTVPNPDQASAPSNTVSVALTPPAAPGLDFTVARIPSNNNQDRVTLMWADVLNETSYRVQRSTSPNFNANVENYTLNANQTTWSQNVSRQLNFYYRIRALSPLGNSPWSNVVFVETP